MELTEQERARLAAAPANLPHEVKDVWVVSWDRHEGDLDRFREFLAGLVLHIVRVRPETAGMFAGRARCAAGPAGARRGGRRRVTGARSAGLTRRSRSAEIGASLCRR
jgi:hypothetical protein